MPFGWSKPIHPDLVPLHVLVTQEPDGHFAAHCLELDLVAEAPTRDQAVGDIEDVIRAAIHYAVDNDNLDHLFKPAPPECWTALSRARTIGQGKVLIEVPADDRGKRQYESFLYAAAGAVCHA